MKPARAILGIALLFLCLASIPLPAALLVKNGLYSVLRTPLIFSQDFSQALKDLFLFRRNAEENRRWKEAHARRRFDRIRLEELSLENVRLTGLLELKRTSLLRVRRVVAARVIGRSPLSWNRVLLIDKGSRQGLKPHMPVMASASLIGQVIETGPSAAKVLLITDPNFRAGVLVQRNRQEGVLFGTLAGQCRVKYIPIDAAIQRGDTIETAGFGGYFPKGLPVGAVEHSRKEPAEIYQVIQVKPFADLNEIEEVMCIE